MDSHVHTQVAVSAEVLRARLAAERERIFQSLSILKITRQEIFRQTGDHEEAFDSDSSITWALVAAEEMLDSIAGSLETIGTPDHSNEPR